MLHPDRRRSRAQLLAMSPEDLRRSIAELEERLGGEIANPLRRMVLEASLEDHRAALTTIESLGS